MKRPRLLLCLGAAGWTACYLLSGHLWMLGLVAAYLVLACAPFKPR